MPRGQLIVLVDMPDWQHCNQIRQPSLIASSLVNIKKMHGEFLLLTFDYPLLGAVDFMKSRRFPDAP